MLKTVLIAYTIGAILTAFIVEAFVCKEGHRWRDLDYREVFAVSILWPLFILLVVAACILAPPIALGEFVRNPKRCIARMEISEIDEEYRK